MIDQLFGPAATPPAVHGPVPEVIPAATANALATLEAERLALSRRVETLEAQLALVEKHNTLAMWTALDRVYDHILKDRILACTVCGHQARRDGFEVLTSTCIFGGGTLERYRCPGCDTVFGAMKFLDQPEPMIDLDYRLLYATYKEANTTSVEVRTFQALNPTREGTYINWGCGAWNSTVDHLRSEGWNVWGYEPSATVASPFVITEKSQLPPAISGIFSNNVIEHFLDPVAQFREFHSLLQPGARMAHSSPCYEYRFEYTRFHTYFPLGRSPAVLAEKSGFRLLEQITDETDILYGCSVFER